MVFLRAFVACGGRAQTGTRASAAPDAAAGSGVPLSVGGAATVGGGTGALLGFGGGRPNTGGFGGASSAGASSATLPGCPDPTLSATCPALKADLDFSGTTSSTSGSVWVEPLQIPQYGTRPPAYPWADLPDPSLWDRSAMPAGACVFRLHGVPASCLRPGFIFFGSCAQNAIPEAPRVAPGSYYDSGQCGHGIAPGCPVAVPWNRVGYWWYLLAQGADTDVVVCAPECADLASNGDACLEL